MLLIYFWLLGFLFTYIFGLRGEIKKSGEMSQQATAARPSMSATAASSGDSEQQQEEDRIEGELASLREQFEQSKLVYDQQLEKAQRLRRERFGDFSREIQKESAQEIEKFVAKYKRTHDLLVGAQKQELVEICQAGKHHVRQLDSHQVSSLSIGLSFDLFWPLLALIFSVSWWL